jgi:hypothetical protein
MKSLFTIAALGCYFLAGTGWAQESVTRAEIQELREKLERLERKLAADEGAARNRPPKSEPPSPSRSEKT